MEIPDEKSKICLSCGGRNHKNAASCKYCNGGLGPTVDKAGNPKIRSMPTVEYLARMRGEDPKA